MCPHVALVHALGLLSASRVSSYKDANPPGSGPHPSAQSTLITFPKAHLQMTLGDTGGWASLYELWGGHSWVHGRWGWRGEEPRELWVPGSAPLHGLGKAACWS